MRNIVIDQNDQKQTLIKFLNKYLAKAPNSLLYKWIRTKKIKVNKKRTEPSQLLHLNDEINIYIYDEELSKWEEEKKEFKSKIQVDIAFENSDVMIMDKDQNILVHAASPEDYGKNLVDYMIDLMISKKEYIPRLEKTFRPAIVNRIDRNTMGLVIGAKTRQSLLELNGDKTKIRKFYLAIVEGSLDKEIHIENKLEKTDNNIVKVSQNGKESSTLVRPISANSKYSLVEIELLTGRTHQIRTSLAHIGHPILGDKKYGKDRRIKGISNQQLVAYKLVFSEDIKVKSLQGLEVTSKYTEYINNTYERLIGRNND